MELSFLKCGYDKAGLRNLDPSEGYMHCDVKVLGWNDINSLDTKEINQIFDGFCLSEKNANI